ncbi:MAG: hypothetical protein ACE5IO_06480 [Thermoplasmata archaeon]
MSRNKRRYRNRAGKGLIAAVLLIWASFAVLLAMWFMGVFT